MTMLGAGLIILVIAFAAVGFLWVLPAWREYRGKKTRHVPRNGTVRHRRGRCRPRRGLRVGRRARRQAEGLFAVAGAGRVRAGLPDPAGGVGALFGAAGKRSPYRPGTPSQPRVP